MVGHPFVGVAMQDHLGAEAADRRLEGARVGEAAQRRAARHRRMVNENDARQPSRAGFLQDFGEGGDLPRAQTPGRHQRRGRDRRAEADQGDVATHAHEREGLAALAGFVAACPRREGLRKACHRVAHIGVVVAGREGDVGRIAERSHPCPPRDETPTASAMLTRSPVTATWSGALGAHVGDEPGQRRHVAQAFARRASN